MALLQEWELQQRLSALLPLGDDELGQIISYSASLPRDEATKHLHGLLGDGSDALRFIDDFNERMAQVEDGDVPGPTANGTTATNAHDQDVKTGLSEKGQNTTQNTTASQTAPPAYAPPPGLPPAMAHGRLAARHHTNAVIEAANVRARDEQEMQQMLQNLQYSYGIYNSEIEPEHDTEYYCNCPIHLYKSSKWRRYGIQDMWSKAVMYPGEKAYDDNQYFGGGGGILFSGNPYQRRVVSPYGYNQMTFGMPPKPKASWHRRYIHQTISLNNELNREAQAKIEAREPKHSIWDDEALDKAMSNIAIGDKKRPFNAPSETQPVDEKTRLEKRQSVVSTTNGNSAGAPKASGFSKFRKSIGIKSSDERAISKVEKAVDSGKSLRDQIIGEENGRWPDDQWRQVVYNYQAKVGMTEKIRELREKSPIQYLHLLRAGYFEPIPVAWADQASNPLKFSIEGAAGWRGITPAWRGYEDTAEERLYWCLNHRINPEGATLTRMKPDQISELEMARARMATAVEPPPLYFDALDTCHIQHTSEGYSRQVMPPPFRPYDRPEVATDDTMILLDVSGSMDFMPVRPCYDQYLITKYERGTQPKNKDVAKAIIRRFTDAMANHDHQTAGYDLVTFSSSAKYIGTVNHQNLEQMWRKISIQGGTRVMTGWQKCKSLHFEKHSESATYHPVYGWQAGPETPMLRLLLLLDGEATDMDEFELDLLGLSWAHVTIFLIGVEGCPHHHRHANELQRISDVNHHVSFVDAQGNTPERLVTHELLRRHLGYDVSYEEFTQMEQLPAYTE